MGSQLATTTGTRIVKQARELRCQNILPYTLKYLMFWSVEKIEDFSERRIYSTIVVKGCVCLNKN